MDMLSFKGFVFFYQSVTAKQKSVIDTCIKPSKLMHLNKKGIFGRR